jgi:diguanylate cyclase (GGDEF)-like protein
VLDIRTLMVVVATVAAVNAAAWIRWSIRHGRFAGLAHFAVANLLVAMAMVLVSQRGSWPDLATTVLANLLNLSGLLLNHEGIRRFAGANWPWWRTPLWLLIPLAVASSWHTFVEPSVQHRILWNTGCLVVGFVWIIHDLRSLPEPARALLRPLAWVFGAFAALMGLRWLYTFGQAPIESIFDAGWVHAVAVLAYIAFILMKDLAVLDATVARLIGESRRLAEIDPLTGLANRRMAMVTGAVALSRLRTGDTLTVVMLDLDHFKAINDGHGHLIGDSVLVEVARELAASVPASGLAARFGGEEFILLLPGLRAGDAVRLAEALRERLSGLRAPGAELGRLSASFGVAEAVPGCSLDALIARADHALLAAKAAGRNRVMVAPVAEAEATRDDRVIMPGSQE